LQGDFFSSVITIRCLSVKIAAVCDKWYWNSGGGTRQPGS
jgi:hypothetical protein